MKFIRTLATFPLSFPNKFIHIPFALLEKFIAYSRLFEVSNSMAIL